MAAPMDVDDRPVPQINNDESDADSDLEELQGDIAKFDESVREFLASHHGNKDSTKPTRGGFKGGRGSRGPRKAAKPRGDITARLSRVNQAFLSGDYTTALDLVSEVIRINAETHQAWTALASIFREQGEPKRALSAMVYAAHLRDKDFSGWMACASYAMDIIEDDDDGEVMKTARLCYSAALKADPTSLDARLAKAAICHRQGHYSQAILEYNIALRYAPYDLDIVRKVAETCADNNHSEASVSSAIAAYGRFFDNAKATMPGDLGELWYDVGIYVDLFAARNRYEEAIHELRQLSRWIVGRKSEEYWDNVHADDREWDIEPDRRAEIPEFAHHSSDNGSYGHALPLDLRARLAIYRFKVEAPLEAQKHMMLIDPEEQQIKDFVEDFPALAYDLAEELRRYEEPHAATKFLEILKALPGDPDATILLQLGRCYLAIGEQPLAEESFLAAIDADEDIIDARVELANMYENAKEDEEALILAAEAMALRDARTYAGMRQGVNDYLIHQELRRPSNSQYRRLLPAPPRQDSAPVPSRPPEALQPTAELDLSMPIDPALVGTVPSVATEVSGRQSTQHPPHTAPQRPVIPKRYRPKRLAGADTRQQDEQRRAIKLSQQYTTVKTLRQQIDAGQTDLVPRWMQASKDLVDDFRSLKRFYSWEKYLGFLGPRPSADRPVQQPDTELSQLYQRLARSTQAEQMGRDKSNFGFDGHRGISFDDWLDIFLDYAIGLAVDQRQQEAYQVCEAAKDSTVFQSSEHDFLIYVAWSVCAVYTNDEETCVSTARQLMRESSSSDAYRVFGLLSKLCQSPISWYTSGPAQKYILRQIKAIDQLHESLFASNSVDIKPGSVRSANISIDVCLLMLYGHILFTSRSYTYAIGYFLRARALDPQNPMISLCLGLAYVHYGLKRQASNRQYLLLQGQSFITEYLESDDGECGRPMAERYYNVGRLFQLLGLNALSAEYYRRASDANRGEGNIKDIDINIAMNSVVSLLAAGNNRLAIKTLKEKIIL